MAGELNAPTLAEQLRPYHDQVKALTTDDPNAVLSLIRSETETERVN